MPSRPLEPLSSQQAAAQRLGAAWAALPAGGLRLELCEHVDSTNAELMRRCRAGQTEPLLLWALQQSAGRGRLGRSWLSAPPADGQPGALTFSLGLWLAPQDWSGLSLAVGLALAQALHPALRLKWPNDLWWQGCKLGGVLIETAQPGPAHAPPHAAVPGAPAARFAVIGVGLNLRCPPAQGLSTPPAALDALLGAVSAAQVLERVLPPLWAGVHAFARHGFAPLRQAWCALDALHGCAVTLSDGRSGLADGVDADGALRLRAAPNASGSLGTAAVLRVTSAEVSLRAAPAAPPTRAQPR